MELWIRSQDREMLYKTNELFLDFKICEELGIKEYYVNVNHETFGTYKTKERALEVLDEIQKILQPQMVLSKVGKPIAETCDGLVYIESDEYDAKELSTYVYEMPKE